MNRKHVVGALSLAIAVVAMAQGFKVYPGGKKYTPPETEESKEAAKAAPDVQATIYLTDDGFEKVAAFYRGIGKEYELPGMKKGGKLPSGQKISMAFFVFDGAENLKDSKSWLKVQRPYIGSMDPASGEFKDVRDVTSIELVEKK